MRSRCDPAGMLKIISAGSATRRDPAHFKHCLQHILLQTDSPKTIRKNMSWRERRDPKRCRSDDQKTVRTNNLYLWCEKMCFKPAAESGNRGAGAKIRRQRVPDSGSCE